MPIIETIVAVSAIVTLVAQAVSTATGIARDVIRAKYGKQLNQVAKKISPMLNSNENLRNQINSALQNQNSKLASDLLMASPLSSVVSTLRENILINEKGMSETDKHFDEQKELAESTDRDAQKIGMALEGNLASATEGKHAWLGQSGQNIRDNVAKLEQTQKDVMNKLQAAKKKENQHIPSNQPASINSNKNIGVMDRTGTSPVPTLTMKGNN